jgi:hypothetical protein
MGALLMVETTFHFLYILTACFIITDERKTKIIYIVSEGLERSWIAGRLRDERA